MPISFAQQVAVKRLLMRELTAIGAGNLVLFKLIGKVDTCEDAQTLLTTLQKAVALLVDENAAVELTDKVRRILTTTQG